MSEPQDERWLKLAALVKKWRNDAEGITAMGYSQQGERVSDCADELDAILSGEQDASKPDEGPPHDKQENAPSRADR